jgi:hypothetical protein
MALPMNSRSLYPLLLVIIVCNCACLLYSGLTYHEGHALVGLVSLDIGDVVLMFAPSDGATGRRDSVAPEGRRASVALGQSPNAGWKAKAVRFRRPIH